MGLSNSLGRASGFAVLAAAGFLAACGGGGSGGGTIAPVPAPSVGGRTPAPPSPSPGPSGIAAGPAPSAVATPVPSPTASPLVLSGALVELASNTALTGFTVTVGRLPDASTCLAGQNATTQPCGVPASPLPVVTTSASGAFAVPVPVAGTYMLTIAKDGTFATLHRSVSVAASVNLGTVHIAALSSDEQAWLADVNAQRVSVSFPPSYGNLVVDEYAEEEARAEVAAIANSAQPYGDATELIYARAYLALPGALYGVAGVADLVNASRAYGIADISWTSGEKINCPGGNWQTCPFAPNTGHYIAISNTDDVWVGMGESAQPLVQPGYGADWAYAMLLPQND